MISQLVFNQVALMLGLIFVGYIAFKFKILTKEGSKEFSRILTLIVTPVVIIHSFLVESTPEKTGTLLFSLLIGFIALFVTFGFAFLTKRKNPILQYGVSFANAGFIGIPLIYSSLGSEAVFYMLPFFSLQVISTWTLGVFMLTRDKNMISLKQLMVTPTIWAIVIGLFMYFTQIQFDAFTMNLIDYIRPIYSPLAMFVIGALLAEIRFKDMFGDKEVYLAIFYRLVLIPFLIMLIFTFIPGFSELQLLTKTAVLIVSSAPAGANTAILAHMFDLKSHQAVKMVTLSTLLSVLTIPLIVYIFENLLSIFTSI